jgi:hypothetical protein
MSSKWLFTSRRSTEGWMRVSTTTMSGLESSVIYGGLSPVVAFLREVQPRQAPWA